MQDGDETDENNNDTFCPLFMDGLPQNFADNPQLAAIASLLEESDDDENIRKPSAIQRGVPVPNAGGGKARSRTSRSSRSHKPYSVPKKKEKTKQQASLGEAQLFLNMWKI